MKYMLKREIRLLAHSFIYRSSLRQRYRESND